MPLDDVLHLIPTYVLVFFRLAGMTIFAPLFGSAKIPRRVRLLIVSVLALSMCGGITHPAALPETTWGLAIGIGGEMMFGLAMGTIMSFVFIAAQWAGEMMGQQMGLNLSEVFDPQFGAQGSLVGDFYFMIVLVIFLAVGGHRAMLMGVHDSFEKLPLLSIGVNQSLMNTMIELLSSATTLALQLASPMLVTMLIADLALGFISKSVPQINVMTAGMSMRSMLGMIVIIAGLILTSDVMSGAVLDSMAAVRGGWTQMASH